MRQRVGPILRVLAVPCLLASAAGAAAAQDEGDLTARQRVFPGVGPGLRTVKRGADGRLYILASPSPGLVVFDRQGKQVLSIGELPGADPSAKTGHPLITFGEDCDGAADGKIYVADRGAKIFPSAAPSQSSPKVINGWPVLALGSAPGSSPMERTCLPCRSKTTKPGDGEARM